MKFNISKCFVMRITQSKEYKVVYDYQLHSSLLVQLIIVSTNWGWFLNQTCKYIEAITARANSNSV